MITTAAEALLHALNHFPDVMRGGTSLRRHMLMIISTTGDFRHHNAHRLLSFRSFEDDQYC
jgi:hypothetical protein